MTAVKLLWGLVRMLNARLVLANDELINLRKLMEDANA